MMGEGGNDLSNDTSNVTAVAATSSAAIASNETPVPDSETSENVSPSDRYMAVDDESALSRQDIPVGSQTDKPPGMLVDTPPAGPSLPPSPTVSFDEEESADQRCLLIECEQKPQDDMQVIHPPCLKDKKGAWE
jgi:hypothetical protein